MQNIEEQKWNREKLKTKMEKTLKSYRTRSRDEEEGILGLGEGEDARCCKLILESNKNIFLVSLIINFLLYQF